MRDRGSCTEHLHRSFAQNTPMHSIRALDNLRGFAWIIRFKHLPLGSKLPLIFLAVMVFALVLYSVGLPVPRLINTIVGLSFIISTLVLWIIMATAAEHELQTLLGELEPDHYVAMLAPDPGTAWLETILGFSIGISNLTAIHFLSGEQGLWIFQYLFNFDLVEQNTGLYLFVLIAIMLMTWGGVITVHLLFFLFRHYKAYLAVSHDMPINLFDLESCQMVSRPLLRYWLLVVLVISTYLLFSQFSASPETQTNIFAIAVALPLVAVLVLLSWLFLKPVWIIRERIKGLKIHERELLKRAILGDRTALAETHIAASSEEFATPDLIYYEEHISKLWEWPIQREMQRIAFYTLIPPAAWIMAALVERLVDTIL